MYPEMEDDQLDYRIDKIFEFIDLNASGEIDYSEFIAATLKLDQ
jgi:calcium-dependent protein kinase